MFKPNKIGALNEGLKEILHICDTLKYTNTLHNIECFLKGAIFFASNIYNFILYDLCVYTFERNRKCCNYE